MDSVFVYTPKQYLDENVNLLGVVALFNLSSWEAEAGRPLLVRGQSALYN